jgi:hypothetical protein
VRVGRARGASLAHGAHYALFTSMTRHSAREQEDDVNGRCAERPERPSRGGSSDLRAGATTPTRGSCDRLPTALRTSGNPVQAIDRFGSMDLPGTAALFAREKGRRLGRTARRAQLTTAFVERRPSVGWAPYDLRDAARRGLGWESVREWLPGMRLG